MTEIQIPPEVTLKEARNRRDDAHRHITAGIDPCAKRRAEKDAQADT